MEAELGELDDAIEGLKKEKELQSGGEVKELQEQYDLLSRQLVHVTSQWNVKQKALKKERTNLQQVLCGVLERVCGCSPLGGIVFDGCCTCALAKMHLQRCMHKHVCNSEEECTVHIHTWFGECG